MTLSYFGLSEGVVSASHSGPSNCDFELKNGPGFWGRGLVAGARFEHTTLSIIEGLKNNCLNSSLFKWLVMGKFK